MRLKQFSLVGAALTVSLLAAAESPADRAAALASQLGNGSYERREAAARQLRELGTPALPALRAALETADPEVRRRAGELLEHLQRRADAERILKPKRVRLSFQNEPVLDTLDRLSAALGSPILFEGDRSRLRDRRVTMEMDDLPYWEVVDRFTRQCKLTEKRPEPMPTDDRLARAQRGNVIDFRQAATVTRDTRLVFVDGPPPTLPTHLAGALRFRAYPTLANLPGHPRREREYQFALEVAAEPDLVWHGISTLRVEAAVDEHGQKLTQPATWVATPEMPTGMEEVFVVLDQDSQLPGVGSRFAPVRLRQAERPSTSIRELSGTVSASLQTPPEPVAVVANVLASVGKSVRASDDSVVKILAAEPREGTLMLRVEVVTPAREAPNLVLRGARVIRVNRGVVRFRSSGMPREGSEPVLALANDKGEQLRPSQTEYETTTNGSGTSREYVLYYKLDKPGESLNLTYRARRQLTIEVPFTLRDIPLP